MPSPFFAGESNPSLNPVVKITDLTAHDPNLPTIEMLGYADAGVVKDGRTMPIKFRIEKDAVGYPIGSAEERFTPAMERSPWTSLLGRRAAGYCI